MSIKENVLLIMNMWCLLRFLAEIDRVSVFQNNKTLLVPTPRLRHGLFNQINVPEDGGKDMLKICSTSQVY